MNENARVWLYQANRFLSNDEVNTIESKGRVFVDSWNSHGALMDASIEVRYNRVIVVAADEEQAKASGCGIDKSVRFIQELGSQLGIDFFQRTQVLYKTNETEIADKPIHEFWAMRKAGIITESTIVIDNTIKTVGDLKTVWEIPFNESWHNEMWVR